MILKNYSKYFFNKLFRFGSFTIIIDRLRSGFLKISQFARASIIVSVLLATFASDAKSTVTFLNGGNVPDDIIFFDEEQNRHSLDQFEGETILLVFWATWCAACIKEMPDLDILQKDFRKLPFSVIPISEDYQGVKIIQEHFKSYQIRYLPIYYDYKNQLFKAFSIVGLPTSILINSDGKKIASFTNNTNWHDEKVREIILSSIPGGHPEPKNTYNEQSLNQPAKPLKPIKKGAIKKRGIGKEEIKDKQPEEKPPLDGLSDVTKEDKDKKNNE